MRKIKNRKKIIVISFLGVSSLLIISGLIFANSNITPSPQEDSAKLVDNTNYQEIDKDLNDVEDPNKTTDEKTKIQNQPEPVTEKTKSNLTTPKNEPPLRETSADLPKYKSSSDFSEWNKSCDPKLIVINKDNLIPQNYNAQVINYKDKQINKIIEKDLDDMIKTAEKEGINLYVSSGYRSVEWQTKLFNNQVERCKKQGYKDQEAEKKAATVVARPRTSEHNAGLAIDFNGVRDDFYTTKEYTWLINHGPDYGFILRYDKNKQDITHVIYEPWHFRYVGKEYARDIAKSGLCLEEYIKSLV